MKRTTTLMTLAAPLLGAILLNSCTLMAVSGAAILITEEFRDNAVSTVVPLEPAIAWTGVLASLSDQSNDLVHRDDAHNSARTMIDGGEVTVYVEQFDLGQTRILVEAKKYMVHSQDLSVLTLERIEQDLMNR
ncbi:MAG TPA: hypothetical protein EYQ25_04980 [Planctomycetes bacterium]|nr:hypothetical protein [Planctomycetota bacterium]HIL36090.1 hypothetical protein [Planctomycetota bacterium]